MRMDDRGAGLSLPHMAAIEGHPNIGGRSAGRGRAAKQTKKKALARPSWSPVLHGFVDGCRSLLGD